MGVFMHDRAAAVSGILTVLKIMDPDTRELCQEALFGRCEEMELPVEEAEAMLEEGVVDVGRVNSVLTRLLGPPDKDTDDKAQLLGPPVRDGGESPPRRKAGGNEVEDDEDDEDEDD